MTNGKQNTLQNHLLAIIVGGIGGGAITGLNNMGAIFHPALTLLNAARIESTGGEFQFYIDGVSPSVARVSSQPC